MKKIRMQYPYDSSGRNPSYDGRLHDVQPTSLYRTIIRGIPFYVMSYHDLTLNSDMITLVVDINGQIAKVPLSDYSTFSQFLESANLTPISPEKVDRILPNEVGLSEQMDASNLFPPVPPTKAATLFPPVPPIHPRENNFQSERKNVIDVSLYVPTRDNEPICTVYRQSLITTEAYYSYYQTFKFEEEPLFSELYQGIARNRRKNGTVEFDIDVPPGTTASQIVLDETGRAVKQLLLLIPGTHHYTVTYADTLSKQKYDAAKNSLNAEITARLRDRESMTSAFRGGFSGRLPIEFSDKLGKKRQFDAEYTRNGY